MDYLSLQEIRDIASSDSRFKKYFKKTISVPTERYFHGDNIAKDVFESKYAHEINGRKETPGEVFWRVAGGLAQYEEDKEFWRRVWYMEMYEGWFRAGGSIMSGVGITEKRWSLFNCTTIPLEEDSLEGIFKCFYIMAKCAAYRQGVGVDLSVLRPRGAPISNSAEVSTGSVSWGEFLQLVGDYVGQLGRRPAILESLKIHHPDIEEFISCKDTLDRMNNVNISVQITDDFMRAVKEDKDWELHFEVPEHNWKFSKKIKARELFRKIAQHAWMTGEPGIQYIDLMKRGSIQEALSKALNKPEFEIISTNACSEKPLPGYSVCDLLSINMKMFSHDNFVEELSLITRSIVRFLDNVITYELDHKLSPVKQQEYLVRELREIGCGFTNLHGWLLDQGIDYDSDEAIERAEEFVKNYAHEVFKSSLELGKEKGEAPAIKELKETFPEDVAWDLLKNSDFIGNILDEFYKDQYPELTLRNCALMSIAPAGSISIVFPRGCISSGVEPVVGWYYWRKTRAVEKGKYTYYFVIPKEVKEFVLSQDIDPEDRRILEEFPGSVRDDSGKIGETYANILKKYIKPETLKPAHLIDPLKKVKLMGRIYKWVDAAISCTFNMRENVPVDLVEEIYLKAWEEGVRAVTVYRDGSRDSVLIFESPVEYEKRFKGGCLERPKDIVYHCAPKRPKDLPCEIHHCTVKGKRWLVLVGLFNGKPYEIFAGEYDPESLYIPKSQKSGIIRKNGKGKYSLLVNIRGKEVEYEDLASLLMNDEYKALTRLISTSLRHGTLPEFIVQQLKKSEEGFLDFSSVVARVLSRYITNPQLLTSNEKCPNCGKIGTMLWQEGCQKCAECGFSKCG